MDRIVIDVREQEDIAKSRRAARGMAASLGMDKYQITEVETSTSELATNLIRHAEGGVIAIEIANERNQIGVRIVSTDSGPGIADIGLAMTEGYSTEKSIGSGLPGVKRMMDEFEIESQPGKGTRVVATKWR